MSFPAILTAAELNLKAHINKTRLKVGERIIFTVTVSGSYNRTLPVKLPDFSDFHILSSNRYSNYNRKKNKILSTTKYTFIIVPKEAGRFTIDSAELEYKGKSYKTQPFEIEVIPPSFPYKDKRKRFHKKAIL